MMNVPKSLATVAALLVLAGCGSGSNLGQVTGTVTLGGQPLSLAQVEFNPKGEGRNSSGVTDSNGNYTLRHTVDQPGALIGKHKVKVIVMPPPGSPPIYIPAEYGSASTLEFDVRAGSNRFDIDIPSS